MKPICEVWHLGNMPYQQAWDLQNRLADERGKQNAPDRLLLVEHPPVYTLGTGGKMENLRLSADQLAEMGVDVLRVDRGGDITFHGIGQIVGYPIIQLTTGDGLRGDFVAYLRNLETLIMRTLADDGIESKVIPGLTGVWVDTPRGEEKIAAIGVKITVKAVTKHGFALNVNTDLRYFDGIIPCGIHDKGVTSMAAHLDRVVAMSTITDRIIAHFGALFAREMVVIENHEALAE